MNVRVVKTGPVKPLDDLFALLDTALPTLQDGSIVAVTSKVVALCEGRVAPMASANKDDLIKQETSYYLPSHTNPYNVTISVARGLLIASGGIDESNGDNHYVLLPKDPQKSANDIRQHLVKNHSVSNVGVILTDSTTRPFQWGTTGICLAHSGFESLKSYVGQHDIFGRQLVFQKNNIANGLAAAAVVMMGEGAEQTPIAEITDVPFVNFVPRDPTAQELAALHISIEEDLYAQLLKHVPWQKGDMSEPQSNRQD